jgi:hypothetical protein
LGNNQPIISFLFIFHLVSTAAFAAGLFYQLKSGSKPLIMYDRSGWIWIILLGITGMFQMSASSNYTGLLEINSIWATALLLKHGLILILIMLMGFQTFVFIPAIQRADWKKSSTNNFAESEIQSVGTREKVLQIQAVLFVLILIATGITRAS